MGSAFRFEIVEGTRVYCFSFFSFFFFPYGGSGVSLHISRSLSVTALFRFVYIWNPNLLL
jgi:hypothetical protein